ncbi:MAG TPA: FxsA family protein [Mycobacteriales bacterium]
MIGPLAAVLIVAEIVAFVAVAHATSWGLAILLLIATSVIGASVARRTAVGAFRRLGEARRSGRAPGDAAVADSAVAFAGSVLLVLPGFVTDALGLTMVFPPTRRLVRLVIGRRLATRLLRRRGVRIRTFGGPTRPPPAAGGSDVIEGTLDDNPDSTTPR